MADNDPHDFSLPKASEETLIRWALAGPQRVHVAMGFALDSCVGWSLAQWTFEIWVNLPRSYLELNPREKPGDIDLLIVPSLQGDRFVERSLAIEVKRGVIPFARRQKALNSLGTTQALGLLRDGFPLVGLLQFVFVEEAPKNEWADLPVYELGVVPVGQRETIDWVSTDTSFVAVPPRHEGRLKSALPDEIGYHVLCLSTDESRRQVTGYSLGQQKRATPNPNRKAKMLSALRALDVPPEYSIVFGHNDMVVKGRDRFSEPSPLDAKRGGQRSDGAST